ncbi:MAG: T9SS type A sorting domain-containing protein [Candidatus Marinimicrobia bacterium]|nr:T9SS type A sorting domain-containing protein [Candidatus Neomarinimicrobiota bacterium]
MKKMLVALFLVVLAFSAFGSAYSFEEAVICGNERGTMDSTFVNAPGFSHPYGVAVAGNGRVWTHSMNGTDRYDKAIMIYDPEFFALDTIGPTIIGADGVEDDLGSGRSMITLGNGDIAIGDWTNDKIRVFDQSTYACIAQSDSTILNCGGGMSGFVYDDEQYFLSHGIFHGYLVLWDDEFNVVDTLTGGVSGRNIAATEDGNKIICPTLGGKYFIEWTGNPDDGYVSDTVWLADLDETIGNIMYVSAGPNDYFWLFSRDDINDGVLVCDPLDDYAVKLFTNTDSSATSPADFSLGMVVDNMANVWLANGLKDTADIYTPASIDLWNANHGAWDLYLVPEYLRAPCQVAYSWTGNSADPEYLYLADYYGYTLKQFSRTTETSVWENTGYVGENGFKLNIAYPNPFNPSVTIPYVLSANGNVKIDMYDVAGKKVASMVNEYKFAGDYEVHFDASNLSSGNYVVKMTFANKSVTQKVALVK